MKRLVTCWGMLAAASPLAYGTKMCTGVVGKWDIAGPRGI
jgi:hypothetical protein